MKFGISELLWRFCVANFSRYSTLLALPLLSTPLPGNHQAVFAMSAITTLESSNVLRNFVKVGISSIAYLRNLFAESVFEDTVIGGLQLKRLTRSIPESAALLDWIDHGVFDAMGHEYLKDLVVSIHNGQSVALESYTFSLRYGSIPSVDYSEGGVAYSDISVESAARKSSEGCINTTCSITVSADKEDVKQQTVKVLRDLVLLAQSLSPLPESRYLSMRLMYYDDRLPEEYEPQYFRNVPCEEELHVEALNVEQQVGALETGHHNLSVDVRSCCYIDETVTNYKTSVRTFDTLTRRPVMSCMKPHVAASQQRPISDTQTESSDGVTASYVKLPPISSRKNDAQLSAMKGGSVVVHHV